jgi:hypothetical protein
MCRFASLDHRELTWLSVAQRQQNGDKNKANLHCCELFGELEKKFDCESCENSSITESFQFGLPQFIVF